MPILPNEEPYVCDGARHDPAGIEHRGYYRPMLYDGEPGRILMRGVGVWIKAQAMRTTGTIFAWQQKPSFPSWLYVAMGQVRELEDLCGSQSTDIIMTMNCIVQIPVASAVVQRIGIDQTINEIKRASQVIVTHPRHEPRQGKPGAMDILAIYRTDFLNVWDDVKVAPFYRQFGAMGDVPEGHICFCGYPLYGGTYKEDC